jgi:hypothetical protein
MRAPQVSTRERGSPIFSSFIDAVHNESEVYGGWEIHALVRCARDYERGCDCLSPRCKSLVGEEISDGLSGEGPAIPSRFVRTVNSPLRSEPTTADTTTRARCSVGLRRVMWILVPDCGTCRKVRELEDCL